jgi:hypothetical protein
MAQSDAGNASNAMGAMLVYTANGPSDDILATGETIKASPMSVGPIEFALSWALPARLNALAEDLKNLERWLIGPQPIDWG